MKLRPPPHYANVPADLLFDQDLPDPIFRSAAMLHALAWQSKGEMTPPATVLELAALRGLQERRMYDHLRELKERALIRVENRGNGKIVVYPLRWVGDAGAALSVSELSSEELEELSIPSYSTAKDCSSTAKDCSLVVDVVVDNNITSQKKQQQQHARATAKLCSNEAVERLMALGITQGVAEDLASSCELERVKAWIAYAQQAGNLRDPAAFVVAMLREGENPPRSREEIGRHRYIEGKYAHLIEH